MKPKSIFLALALTAPAALAVPADNYQPVLQQYSKNVYLIYSEAVAKTLTLQTAIEKLIDAPSMESLVAARQAWLMARETWGQTEAFRFYGGPIDDANAGVEGLINAWPLDEAYIDYVISAENAGVINNTAVYPIVNEELILSLNENGSETNISTGFHAIEFLLWGQDLSATGPGARPYTDYQVGTGKNVERRSTYLRVVTQLLLKHIQQVQNAWDLSQTESYGAQFSKQNKDEALTKVFKGLASLLSDELAGERMFVAYESQLQEDEHSCFSDNTHVDIIENLQGVINVWTGDYLDKKGPGLDELFDPAEADKVKAKLDLALAAARTLPVPFDALLIASEESEERKLLLNTILAIQDAGTAVKSAGETLGLTIPTE